MEHRLAYFAATCYTRPMYSFYRALTLLITPLLPLLLQWRLRRGKEDAARLSERLALGLSGTEQGEAIPLLWVHAASMGESASVLPLIDAFLAKHPDWRVMVTTVTVTSAKLMAEKLPPRAFHQFAPLDNPIVLKRFFAQWKPQLAFWIESELWPNMAKMTPCPMYLINARMSERSFRRWKICPSLLREMLQCFNAIFPQSEADAERFRTLGAQRVICLGNLKYDAPPLSCDVVELEKLRTAIGNRPVWLASSTHTGEEEQIAEVHIALKKEYPDLLTMIVPRHAPRGDAIAAMLRERGLSVRQRSKQNQESRIENQERKGGQESDNFSARQRLGSLREAGGEAQEQLKEEIYLSDTMGELGLFYRLSTIVFIGGSLVPHGGQNLLEPARLNCAIICGPHMHNFAAVMQEMQQADAVISVENAAELQQQVAMLLHSEEKRKALAAAAERAVQKHNGMVEALLKKIEVAQ